MTKKAVGSIEKLEMNKFASQRMRQEVRNAQYQRRGIRFYCDFCFFIHAFNFSLT